MKMIRTLLNVYFRMIGWSPIGRRLLFLAGEGPLARDLDKQTCKIIGLQRLEKDGPEALIVELSRQIPGDVGLPSVMLVPRHSGYGAHALATTTIATYVFPLQSTLPDWDSMVAMMDVRICN